MSEPTSMNQPRIEAEEDSATRESHAAGPSVEAGPASAAHNTPHSDLPRKRDKEFWFEDGTVILVACGVEFRVYKGILADHSPVFKTMFSLPQSPSDEPSRCPEVELVDSPEYLRHVLRACMPKSDFSPFKRLDPSCDMISATIRFGHKYEMLKLVDHSVAFLRSYYPRDFSSWEKLNSCGPQSWEFEDSIVVINLARLTGEHSLLPTALSICCMLEAEILGGHLCEDDTFEYLSHEDLGRCVGAQKELVAAHMGAFVRVFTTPISKECKSANDCRKELRKAIRNVEQYMTGWNGDVLASFLNSSFFEDAKKALCDKCWKELIQQEDKERKDIWKRLPGFFGLLIPGWET